MSDGNEHKINQMRRASTVMGPMNKILVANRGEIPNQNFPYCSRIVDADGGYLFTRR